jgi:hypothetical protein
VNLFRSIAIVTFLAFVVCFPYSPGFAQDGDSQAVSARIEVREAGDNFHREIIRAAVKLQRDGKIKRADVVRLRVAMIAPAFRKQAEDLAIVQMSASGSEATPIGADGQIDRASIDWAGIAAFLEKFIPLLLQLLDAFSWLESPHPMLRQIEFYAVMNTPFELAC